MKAVKKAVNRIKKMSTLALGAFLSSQALAESQDLLAPILGGQVKAMFGSSSTFWKIYILVDVILAGAAWVSKRNWMVFLGTFVLALIPGFFIDTFVFKGVS